MSNIEVVLVRPQVFRHSGAVLLAACAAFFLLASCSENEVSQSATSAAGAKVDYGTKISFGHSGNSAPMRISGWSKGEENFTWTEGKSAVLAVQIGATELPVTLRMKLTGLIKSPELAAQPVEVQVNGQKIADWEVGEMALFNASIPSDLTKVGGTLTFTFKIPRATSPKALGTGEDPRVLGICVSDFELSTS